MFQHDGMLRYIPPMSVHWLIEVDVFADTAKRITAALDLRNQPWSRWHDDIHASEMPKADGPVLFWGSLGAAYEKRVASAYRPGAIGNIEAFRCSEYYKELSHVSMANGAAVFTTVRDLVASPASVLQPLGQPERVFVRPDSPLKPFSGRELPVADLSLAALDHGFYYDDEDLPIAVSAPKKVGREWRFVVANREVAAGCEYVASREGAGTNVTDEARALAAQVASADWQAAPLYVVDVAEVDGGLGVMELNPFSGADLYHCDPNNVIEAASQVAQELFEEKST